MTSTSVYSDMASFLCCKASFSSFDCSFNFSWASHKSLVRRKMMSAMTTTMTMTMTMMMTSMMTIMMTMRMVNGDNMLEQTYFHC